MSESHEPPPPPRDWRESTLGVVFFDLRRFARWAGGREDLEVAAFLQRFYERAAATLEPTGVRLLKFMGDAGLGTFEPSRTADVLDALRSLRAWVRQAEEGTASDLDLVSKLHVGSVVAGTFGPAAAERYDVMGRAVCGAARLEGSDLVLSPEAYHSLPAEAREPFAHDPKTDAWHGP